MPRKQCRTRIRNRGNVRLNKDTRMVALFDQSTDSFITVSQRHAENLEAEGLADRVSAEVDGIEQLLGWKRRDSFVAGNATPTTLTLGTMEAVANASDSLLTSYERKQRDKFFVWPLIGDTKAVCVRPRISDEDRLRGEKLLRRCA